MTSGATLTRGVTRRYGHRFVPAVVRMLVPPAQIGTYLLVHDETPVYVGRSDVCVRQRLRRHPLLGRASHFYWEPHASAALAFAQEAVWFHLLGAAAPRNRIHPARPVGYGRPCPFCELADVGARARAPHQTRAHAGVRHAC